MNEKIETLLRPPLSPDLTPCDFFLFPHTKKYLAGGKIQLKIILRIRCFPVSFTYIGLPKIEFERAFLQWIERLRKYTAANGEYFEKLWKKKVVDDEENTLYITHSTQNEAPSYLH